MKRMGIETWFRSDARASWAALLALALASVVAWAGCGGGSPTDVIDPTDIEVAISPLDPPVPRSVGIALESASGRDVSVQVAGLELEGATGVAFELRFDPEFLDYVGVVAGSFFGSPAVAGASVVEGAPGRLVAVSAGMDQTEGRNGSGTLLTLQFRLKQLRDAQTNLIFGDSQSLVYGPNGAAAGHVFRGARLVTRIRLSS